MNRLSLFLIALTLCANPLRAQAPEGFETAPIAETMQKGDRLAVLAVHFGTTHDDTRALTIEPLNRDLMEVFPEATFREAWTSRMVIRRLKGRGIHRDTPLEALEKLRNEGFTHVVIQPSTLLEGAEMESLRRDMEQMDGHFKELRTGTPLLYSVEDCREVAQVLNDAYRSFSGGDDHVVFVGHGTYTPATATYSQLDHIFRLEVNPAMHVATLEGYPDFEALVSQLKTDGAHRVLLVPLLFVAGDHAKNDIAGDWREQLEEVGFEVEVALAGLGENPAIRALYAGHLRSAAGLRPINLMQKKRDYALGKE